MKVNDTSDIRRIDATRPQDAKRVRSDDAAATTDKVTTDSRTELDGAVAAARAKVGRDRTIRLEAIEAAVRNGTFKPDPERIASRILDDAEVSAMLQAMLRR